MEAGSAGASFFLGTSVPMSGFSMSMYACMSEMADSEAPVAQTVSSAREENGQVMQQVFIHQTQAEAKHLAFANVCSVMDSLRPMRNVLVHLGLKPLVAQATRVQHQYMEHL